MTTRVPLLNRNREVAAVALVDDADAPLVTGFTWCLWTGRDPLLRYAIRRGRLGTGEPKTVSLHRQVLGVTDPEQIVDHINRDGLDCRRENLRVTDRRGNSLNRKLRSDNASGYRGVYAAHGGKFTAQIRSFGELSYLGRFPTAEEAARAYDRKAIELFGVDFAQLNFPEEVDAQRRKAA